jgi:hypothetical protein
MEIWILFVIVSGSSLSVTAVPGFENESSCLFAGNRLVNTDAKEWTRRGRLSDYKIDFHCFPGGPKAAEKR